MSFLWSVAAAAAPVLGGSDTIMYQKISHNVYRIVSGTVTAYIEFRADGWLYWADVGGAACVDYVYVRGE